MIGKFHFLYGFGNAMARVLGIASKVVACKSLSFGSPTHVPLRQTKGGDAVAINLVTQATRT